MNDLETTKIDEAYKHFIRVVIEFTARRDNAIAERLIEIQDVLLAIKGANNMAGVKAAIPVSFMNIPIKNKRETRDEFIALLVAGEGEV